MYNQNTKIIGYHGTLAVNVPGIIENNFKESNPHKEWYGDGVYFFVDGFGHTLPVDSATQFAIDQRKDSNHEIAVLSAAIKVNNDKMLDLTQFEGIKLFNEFRNKVLSKFAQVGKIPKSELLDYDILNSMRKNLGIEFVKGYVYIRFAIQREKEIRSVVPNVAIFVVNNPVKNIQKPSIKLILKRR